MEGELPDRGDAELVKLHVRRLDGF